MPIGVTVRPLGVRCGVGVVVLGGPLRPARSIEKLDLALVQMVAQVQGEVLGREDLACSVRRTMIGAPAAFGARVEVDNRLPREVLDATDPYRVLQRIG